MVRLAFLFSALTTISWSQWKFVVSGDSRNCGDVVMPAIARGAIAQNARFYWHLGDFRAIYRVDQDYAQSHKTADGAVPNIADYLPKAWPDFIDSQLAPFGKLPVFLGIGNHELIPPKTREQLVNQFADWLNAPTLRRQRLADNPSDASIHTYFHWISGGIDFINLDNASTEQFDDSQMTWLRSVLDRDAKTTGIRTLIVGMHEALPDSISESHSMNQSDRGTVSGRQVYQWLVDFRKTARKPVYVLASHSHFYMENAFNSAKIRAHTEVLPGWIVGTAGAERYALPAEASSAKVAITHVYGYLVATISASNANPVTFEFKQLSESDVPASVVTKYTPAFVHECWVGNP